jgi:hypothetical protein
LKNHKAVIPQRAVNPKSVRREERETKAASSRKKRSAEAASHMFQVTCRSPGTRPGHH